MSQPNQNNHNFKDTKIFVGGLAWRTTTDDLRNFFQEWYGEVIDANVVSEGLQGGNLRSKGYGFVVFRNAESANRACALPWPVIDGRQTNVNMAYMRTKNNTNHSNQKGLLNQTGPSHQYQNGLLIQAASHQFQLASQYPYQYTSPPCWAPYYGHNPYMYNAPCYSYSTAMAQYVSAYRMQRNWERMNNQPSVNISNPPNAPMIEMNEEDADTETDSDQGGEISGEDNDINQDVNDQELEIMSGVEDDTKQDVDVTKQLGNGIEDTLQSAEEADENTPQENGNGHDQENGDQEGGEEQEYIKDQVREAI